ncbi:nuclear pore complex protein Nup50-like protein [Dinothrombium tinctorium]|uniref:Nuclear pore complex protein Nup50-like protein n=1 Tax=Dinothrombium tinctorium TaxID=1965070 RepID=A0A3S3NQQ5_9ACAR|nr:nuclear pore complex protein Nup50-like protein [Dinothrombium tinctorium]RWS06343.1 nuclear pore complex protein Nup50-like protein [Dinothrombium tinctorium]RWS07454.1 nuclear pore complex protein Nup50-like protein [Dinothrombium tinctorium]
MKRSRFVNENDANVDCIQSEQKTGDGDLDDEYYAKLKNLNESFLKWIQDHMAKSPHYIFTPVCRDYLSYVEKIENEYNAKCETSKKSECDTGKRFITCKENSATIAPSSNASQSNTSTLSSPQSTSSNMLFTFDSTVKRPVFDFSVKSSENTSSPSFFASIPKAIDSQKAAATANRDETVEENADDDEYQPPKPEASFVEEGDAIYSKRCKLFYKKDNTFVEKGVGTLYVKKQAEDKYQLLIRANTSVGNILLNIQLQPTLPLCSKKNGVLLTCIPNPPLETKNKSSNQSSVSFFIRVKTSEDASELYKKLSDFLSKQ